MDDEKRQLDTSCRAGYLQEHPEHGEDGDFHRIEIFMRKLELAGFAVVDLRKRWLERAEREAPMTAGGEPDQLPIGFDHLPDALQWAWLIDDLGYAPQFGAARWAIHNVAERAEEELPNYRGLDGDIEAEVEAEEERIRNEMDHEIGKEYDAERIDIEFDTGRSGHPVEPLGGSE
jgi:hypothetical protein